jgi:hypothetical protein
VHVDLRIIGEQKTEALSFFILLFGSQWRIMLGRARAHRRLDLPPTMEVIQVPHIETEQSWDYTESFTSKPLVSEVNIPRN